MVPSSREVVTFPCSYQVVESPDTGWMEYQGGIMSLVKPFGAAEIDRSTEREVEGNIGELVRLDSTDFREAVSDSELAADNLRTLLYRVSGTTTREIDNLISELSTLRERLQADANRVQRDVVEYAALSQSVIQLTKIISEGVTRVKKPADAPSISG